MPDTPKKISRRTALTLAAGAAVAPAILGRASRPARAEAPMLGASRSSHHRFKLGAFEITTIRDGAVKVPKVHPIFGHNQKPEDVAAYLAANHLPGDKMAIGFTPVMINTGRELVLFDTGYGEERRDKGAGKTKAAVAAAGYKPEQVDVIVLTHCHPDHVSGMMEDGKAVFPNASYICGAKEYDFWSNPDLTQSTNANMARRAKAVQSNVVPLAEKIRMIAPGDDVVTGIRSMDTSGHTPGHLAFHIESGASRLLIWGDVTNHYVASLQKPDWHVVFDMDKEKAVETRKKVLDMVATEKIPATGYHMPFPAVGYVEKHGMGYRWVPVTYQFDL